MAPTLETLPEELIIGIVEHLDGDANTLRELALVSSRFQVFAESVLYRSVFIRRDTVLQTWENSASKHDWRHKATQKFEIRCLGDGHRGTDYRALREVLSLAFSIRELTIESPFCNSDAWQTIAAAEGWDETLRQWSQPFAEAAGIRVHAGMIIGCRPLQDLTKLTLHLNGTGHEFWTADKHFASIFAHPTVRELHVSSVNLIDNFTQAIPSGRKTPLKRLTLDEVNITQAALRDLLALPTALEYLYLGENRYSPREERHPTGQVYNALWRDLASFIAALAQQKNSLQTLEYISDHSSESVHELEEDPMVGLEDFACLREVHIDAAYTFCGALASIFTHRHRAPPELGKLTLNEYAFLASFDPNRGHVYIGLIAEAVPSLKQLVVICDWKNFGHFPEDIDDQRSHIRAAGVNLKKKGVEFSALRIPEDTHIVRPILYGETEPENVLEYVNDDRGFRTTGTQFVAAIRDRNPDDDDWEDASDEEDADFDVEIFEEVEEEDELMDDEEFDEDDVWDGFQE